MPLTAKTQAKDVKKPAAWPRLTTVAIAVGTAAVVLLVIVYCYLQTAATEYKRFTNPDGHFAVVVYRIPSLFPMMPGQGGDAKGYVRLIDRQGHILQEKRVEIVNTIDFVEWKPEFLNIRLFAEWPLPPRPSSSHRPHGLGTL